MSAATLAQAPAYAAKPIVIAHRGASGYLPEHTLAAYELAVRMGADYIEPDLQLTSDGQLVAMHDATLTRTTNVRSLFAARNGGFRVSDFTLAEIKTLTVVPPAGGTARNTYPGFTPANPDLRVPTFQEVVDLAKQQSALTGRTVGIYPEAKQADPAMEDAILATLRANGYDSPDDKLFVQSFSDETIRSIGLKAEALGLDLPLVVLGSASTDTSGNAGLRVGTRILSLSEVASYADGIGLSLNATNITADYIAQAHALGLQVHGWTFNQPNPELAAAQFALYLERGMDGVFANYPDLGRAAVDQFAAVPEPATWGLMILGVGGTGAVLRRKKAAARPQAMLA